MKNNRFPMNHHPMKKLHIIQIFPCRNIEFIVLITNQLLSFLRSYKQSHIGTNFRSELGNADGKHTQTESLTSNDAAVNTGKFSLNKKSQSHSPR